MAQNRVRQDTTRDDSQQEIGPDSNWLRVSRDTTHESGIPPAAEGRSSDTSVGGEDHLDQALSEAARTEANLKALVRGLKNLTAGATAVLDSTGLLASELDSVRELIAHGNQERAALQKRVQELTQALEESEEKARRELRYVVDQQDLFFAELLTDHERQLAELKRPADESPAGHEGSERVSELIAQRDQAREYALRCERERDLAWQELGVQAPAPRSSLRAQPAGAPEPVASASASVAVVSTKPPSKRISSEYSVGAEDVLEERVASRPRSAEMKSRG